jgi:16S rRNA (uracil1498-N3)-methyltransferase
MRQFLLPRWYAGEPRIALAGEDFHYLARVLRMREGDTCPAVDAHGARYVMRLARVVRAGCDIELTPQAGERSPSSDFELTLLQCLPKGRKIDLIVRQATEAGVERIVPLYSENSLVRPGQDDARLSRLQRVAREALQQSGSARMPEIKEPRKLASIIEGGTDWGTALLFHEKKVSATPLHRLLADSPRAVSVLIGPEGGLSDGEVDLLMAAGFRPVHLEGNILRVETAALYAIGAVKTILQERNAWKPVQEQ